MGKVNDRLDIAKEKIRKLKGTAITTIQTGKQREQIIKNIKN